ncbi:MAG: hypothetical protein WCI51_13445 [Lentisphaerota bacterium]
MRKPGYYWVKHLKTSKWEIAEIVENEVHFIFYEDSYPVKKMFEIGDYIETPEKYKSKDGE